MASTLTQQVRLNEGAARRAPRSVPGRAAAPAGLREFIERQVSNYRQTHSLLDFEEERRQIGIRIAHAERELEALSFTQKTQTIPPDSDGVSPIQASA